ncbi:hypothetical protein IWW45_009540, partial [Coemansia sp. RSA 485]
PGFLALLLLEPPRRPPRLWKLDHRYRSTRRRALPSIFVPWSAETLVSENLQSSAAFAGANQPVIKFSSSSFSEVPVLRRSTNNPVGANHTLDFRYFTGRFRSQQPGAQQHHQRCTWIQLPLRSIATPKIVLSKDDKVDTARVTGACLIFANRMAAATADDSDKKM